MYYPTKQEFIRKAGEGNLIPVWKEILADVETPLSLFKRLDRGEFSFLLESVEKGERWGRYSFLGTNPSLVFKSKGQEVEIIERSENSPTAHPEQRNDEGSPYRNCRRKFKSAQPLAELKKFIFQYKPVEPPSLPYFWGGLVGYVSYDSVRFFEPILTTGDKNIDDLNLPDIFFILADEVLIFDHLEQKFKIVVNAHIPEERRGEMPEDRLKKIYEQATKRIEQIIQEIGKPLREKPLPLSPNLKKKDWKSNFSQEGFKTAVSKAKERILQGDIIQVVLSQRWERELDCPPLNIYRALRCINPSPYMFYLNFKEVKLIGSSPEILVRSQGRKAELRPIAGTRRRGEDPAEDAELIKELLSDPKEKAEHIMLVDLGRNDLGRVCEYNSISIQELMVIEKYSHVMHIVSQCEGRLRRDKDVFELFKACFPAGTVTGAPKIRAMQIIEELEENKRGPYAGAVGYFGFSGNLDSCIAIRTILIKDSKVYIQAGAGIVADSQPEREYKETINKAEAMKEAVEMARTWTEQNDFSN
ncbi:MAG: anthranilate synthase component I [Candidatus Omnitrophica bacterium 4484_213]|nr:MAG: anthranilate synthase component I [Candidatus Omnitrophica bacterium 4484_213]